MRYGFTVEPLASAPPDQIVSATGRPCSATSRDGTEQEGHGVGAPSRQALAGQQGIAGGLQHEPVHRHDRHPGAGDRDRLGDEQPVTVRADREAWPIDVMGQASRSIVRRLRRGIDPRHGGRREIPAAQRRQPRRSFLRPHPAYP
ncbi:hypothetical protein [Actinoplanes sp. NPDC026623]|uniref:hypothetical protein n=1 Tax=Actinoplanes sp. NPDC026623 TaxID=3155610 RepID=UPI003411ACF9